MPTHGARGPPRRQAPGKRRRDKAAESRVQAVQLASCTERRLRFVVIWLQDERPRSLRQPVTQPLRLVRYTFRLICLETAGKDLFDEVSAKPALDLGRSPIF